MTPDHLPQVMAIDAQCYPIPWSREVYESELARTDDRYYVIARPDRVVGNPNAKSSSPNRVVGHAGVAFEESEAHITTVTVSPDSRGEGIGARLFLALALAACRRNTSLALEVAADNPAAQALYRRFGLAPVGIQRGYYKNMGLSPDAVVMRVDNIQQPDYVDRLTKIAVELDRA
ncbi:ribosomal protein S18-alanine N-acetyltransferase [Candidatus Poriferisocius sp.]|uniref:ribosomal protein S18-alanine N-acetyltransferase n=1 Tax=Candidatus Poriferisocius sp. TaxID=3101276 RepID=UPI003B0233C4